MNKYHHGWNMLEKFHESILESNPELSEGVNAFFEISHFAKKVGLKVPKQPSFNVRFGSNIHYDWLIKVNKLIKIISTIPNYQQRLKIFLTVITILVPYLPFMN
ncbi:MAG: hypothetical protein ACTSUR_03745 [Candidatus Heimdallarchaeaceae archaeon]